MGHGGKPWVSDFNDPNYVAGRNAVKTGISLLSKFGTQYFPPFKNNTHMSVGGTAKGRFQIGV